MVHPPPALTSSATILPALHHCIHRTKQVKPFKIPLTTMFAGAILKPPPFPSSGSRRSGSRDQRPNPSPVSSRSPEVRRRSYSPLSDAEGRATSANRSAVRVNASARQPQSPAEASSGLSDVEDGSEEDANGSLSGSPAISQDQASESDNETEAETERLHISPQKARELLNDNNEEDTGDDNEEEIEADGEEEDQEQTIKHDRLAKVSGTDLRPQDLLSDEPDYDQQSSADEQQYEGIHKSPTALAGHKRKRNGQLSPHTGHSSPDGQSPRKRSSVRRSFGLQAPLPTASDIEIEAAVDAAVSSSEDEADAIRKIETARHGSLTPAPDAEAEGVIEEAQVEVEVEEAAEADNEEDEAEAAAKTEDDREHTIVPARGTAMLTCHSSSEETSLRPIQTIGEALRNIQRQVRRLADVHPRSH